MKNIVIAVVATAVIVGGGAFYGGMQYGKQFVAPTQDDRQNFRDLSADERQQRMQQFGQGMPGGSGARPGNRGGIVSGEVLAKDAASLTVKLRDGGSKIVLFSSSTEIGKLMQGTVNDVRVGEQVIVNGSANADGSVTAQSIQIRPSVAGSAGDRR